MKITSGVAAPRLLFVVAAGRGSIGDRQMRALASATGVEAQFIYVDKARSAQADIRRLGALIAAADVDAIVVKGLGWRAGLSVLWARQVRRSRTPYFVTAGDAAGQYERANHGVLRGMGASIYERLLYSNSIGFIGRTGYYVGRAIHLGAPSGMTVEGFVSPSLKEARGGAALRKFLEIPDDSLVVGVSGSINWSDRQRYCYGLELVGAARRCKREDLIFLIVGDGTGLAKLRRLAAEDRRFRFAGRVDHQVVSDYIALFDVAVIGQTRDETGLLRLTTKLPEYLALGVPVLMSAVPAVYDYFDQTSRACPVLPLPLHHPGSVRFSAALAEVLATLDSDDLSPRRAGAKEAAPALSVESVSTGFVPYILNELRTHKEFL